MNIQILGIAAFQPETEIDNNFLAELSPALPAHEIEDLTGISSRRTCLPLNYIVETRNKDCYAVDKIVLQSPTDLATKAAEQALQRANICAEQIGLIVGSGTTPFELTPSEGQRVGERLKIKVPAYDVYSAGFNLGLHLNAISEWKPDRTPEYVLCVHAGAPTTRINYVEGNERYYASDSAVAVVVSASHPGKLTLTDTTCFTDTSVAQLLTLETYGHIMFGEGLEKCLADKGYAAYTAASEKHSALYENTFVIPPHFSNKVESSFISATNLSEDQIWSNLPTWGWTSGNSSLAPLADKWDSLQSGSNILICSADAGITSGYIFLTVN